jgi:GntR family transcriptional regulator
MLFAIEPANGVPIYEQIARQIKFAIAGGAYRPGEIVPSVRDLAQRLAVNPNTVAKAYRDLQQAGILTTLRGTGLAVADGAPKVCRADRVRLIRQRLRQALLEAKQSQLDADQLKRLIDEELARVLREESP